MMSDRKFWLIMIGSILTPIAFAYLFVVETGGGYWHAHLSRAVVISRDFKPSHVIHGTRVASAKPLILVPSRVHVPDRWTARVHLNGRIITADVAHERWNALAPGQSVAIQRRTSPILGRINATWIP